MVETMIRLSFGSKGQEIAPGIVAIGSLVIPPCSDVEAMAKFLAEHPEFSPVLNEEGRQVGVSITLPTWNWQGF